MIKWFIKVYIVMLKIASVILLVGIPYATVSQYSDPWPHAVSTRAEYSETHVIVVFGGSWTSDKGYSRQTLLLIPKAWASPKAIEISIEPKSVETHSGYLLLLIGGGLLVLAVFTIVQTARRLCWQKNDHNSGNLPVS